MSAKSELHTSSYIPSLDGLRGLSIITVLLAHLGYESIVPGGLGVTIFFFISGYLITNLMIDEHLKKGKIYLKLFYLRRLLRLYPPLLLMIVSVTVYLYIFQHPIYIKELFAAVFYYENYFSFYLANGSKSKYFGTLWSLAVEEHFYLVFPFIFISFFKSSKRFIGILMILILIALIVRFLGTLHYNKATANWYCYQLTHTRYDSILYGCLTSLILYVDRSGRFITFMSHKVSFISALLLLGLCLTIRNDVFRNTLRYSFQGLSLMILIPTIVNVPAYKKINLIFSNNAIVFIGKLSYSIYLFHPFAILLCSSIKTHGGKALFIVAAVLLTALFSALSFYLVEKPLGKLRKRLRPADIKPIAVEKLEHN